MKTIILNKNATIADLAEVLQVKPFKLIESFLEAGLWANPSAPVSSQVEAVLKQIYPDIQVGRSEDPGLVKAKKRSSAFAISGGFKIPALIAKKSKD